MKKTLLALAIIILSASSCKKTIPPRMGLLEIQLEGAISSIITKGVIEKDYSGTLPVNFLRKDQKADGTWDAYGAPLDATKDATGKITFSQIQYYLTRVSNDQSKLIGWYPRSSVTFSTSTTIIPIDGKTDILLSNEITGSKKSVFGSSETSTHLFSHKLTQIRVTAYARSTAEKEMWGTITSISVKNTFTSCTIKFPNTVEFGTSGNLDLITKTRTDDNATAVNYPVTLPIASDSAADCGYALISPCSSAGITLTITTSKGGVMDVAVSNELLPGTAYNVSLMFTAKDIQAKANIEEWRNSSLNLTI